MDEVYYVYVVDNDGILKGTLSLKRLLLSSENKTVQDIYNDNLISVKTNVLAEEVSSIMDKYDLVALPVIDNIGRLVGRITMDDAGESVLLARRFDKLMKRPVNKSLACPLLNWCKLNFMMLCVMRRREEEGL